MIHSVDSFKLTAEIDRIAGIKGIAADCLLEINIAGEDSKYGIAPENAVEFAKSLSQFKAINLKGIMCVAPNTEIAEKNRKFFSKMCKLYIDIGNICHNNINMACLSMGMTNDYVVAIEEGATVVRVGTGIFGLRK